MELLNYIFKYIKFVVVIVVEQKYCLNWMGMKEKKRYNQRIFVRNSITT